MDTNEKIAQVSRACERYGSKDIVVLSGVAATGKSYVALAAAQKFTGHPYFVKLIQFHQSFSYEDFIEGLHPTISGGFAPRSGIFLQWNEQAIRDPQNRYVLLIEEFTRANIAAVLGELMTFVEYRDRVFETPVTRRRIKIAKNLTILGTMNPQDRSALEVDDALIRRLRIIECPPSTEQLREVLQGASQTIVDGLVSLFETCRTRHPETFNDLMPFGHGLFKGVSTAADLVDLWHTQIRYLLRRNPQVTPHPYAKDIEELYPWKGQAASEEEPLSEAIN
jgi:5-methylcytosine-specific restriction protein B